MKKVVLFLTIAIGFTIAQADDPIYDDNGRCNTAGAPLPQGVYEPLDACQQNGYVCQLASEPSGAISFWLGTSADCTRIHTTIIETFYPSSSNPKEIDPKNPNHKLRLVLAPGMENVSIFGAAVMSSQLLSAKSDRAEISVIYKFVPSREGVADLNSIHLLSLSRVK